MRKTASLVAVGALLALAAPATAAETLIDTGGMTAPEVAIWLQGHGLEAEQTTDVDGDPMISTSAEGATFNIYFYDCDAGRCRALQFSKGFDLDDGLSLPKVNEWNRKNRYLKAHLDDENDPYVQYDVNLNAGRTISGLDDDFAVWISMLPEFTTFVGW